MDLAKLKIVHAIAKKHWRPNTLPTGPISNYIKTSSTKGRQEVPVPDTPCMNPLSGFRKAAKLIWSLPLLVDIQAR